jgi:hypothetical protein
MPERLDRNAVDSGLDPGEPRVIHIAHERHALDDKARHIGNNLGRAVVALCEARDRLLHVAGQTREITAERITTLKSQAGETRARIGDMAGDVARNITNKGREWSDAAASAAKELRHATAAKAMKVRSQARVKYYRARLRGNQAVREYPVQLVFAAGVAGFLTGVGLRMWRSKHE